MSVKILAISGGSKNGTNDQMAKEALMGAQEMGAEIEFIHMLDLNSALQRMHIVRDRQRRRLRGGSARCIRKDDLRWLEDKIYDADGVIFVMPIFEKGLPGFFRAFQDRFAAPATTSACSLSPRRSGRRRPLPAVVPIRAFKNVSLPSSALVAATGLPHVGRLRPVRHGPAVAGGRRLGLHLGQVAHYGGRSGGAYS